MKKPNFAIIGAPKCGTTSLFAYLQTHPNVFLPRIKEPHYFASDFPGYRRVSRADHYFALFRGCTPAHTAVGDASVFYLYSKAAVRDLYAFNPDVKIVVMLRNPVDMAYSLHSQLLYGFRETQSDFEQAWRLQTVRAAGNQLPPHCCEPSHLQYGEVCRLGQQVERLLNTVPREQVKLILMGDMIQSPRSVYEDVLAFLNVPSDGRTEFPKVNANKVHRWRWFRQFWMHPPFPLSVVKRTLKRTLRLEETWCSYYLAKATTKSATRVPLRQEFRQELIDYFAADVRKLEQILGRDLSHWQKQRTENARSAA